MKARDVSMELEQVFLSVKRWDKHNNTSNIRQSRVGRLTRFHRKLKSSRLEKRTFREGVRRTLGEVNQNTDLKGTVIVTEGSVLNQVHARAPD